MYHEGSTRLSCLSAGLTTTITLFPIQCPADRPVGRVWAEPPGTACATFEVRPVAHRVVVRHATVISLRLPLPLTMGSSAQGQGLYGTLQLREPRGNCEVAWVSQFC